MRLRITSIDEYQFLTCLKHGLWGSDRARFKDWHVGDHLVFIVDKAVAGLAEVASAPFVAQTPIWEDEVYPHRIPITFVTAFLPERRPPLLGGIRDALIAAWGTRYGIRVLTQQLLEGQHADEIVTLIRSGPTDLPHIQAALDSLMAEARAKRAAGAPAPAKPGRPKKQPQPPVIDVGPEPPKEDESVHLKTQASLVRLGTITKCSVWIAPNDRSRLHDGKALGADTLPSLPNLGLSQEATRKISMIDVIWLRQNAPLCAFEIETTTSIYSGLLRMSDLLALVPALKIELFIVAQRDRQRKVMDELDRPTFRKIGLSDYCRFIAIEDLDDLLARVKGFAGHVEPTILDTIAIALDQAAKHGG